MHVFGQYGQLRREVGLLSSSGEQLLKMAQDEDLESELIETRLTVTDNRSRIMIWI